MEDTPENLPRIPRRTAARPFISPGHEGVTGPLDLGKRRSAQLFTPPGSSPAAPSAASAPAPTPLEHADEVESPLHASDAADVDAPAIESFDAPAIGGDGEWAPTAKREAEDTLDADSLLAHRNTMDDDHALFVEQFEPEEIELTSASATSVPDEHSIEVIAYDDANSLLKAAANEGEGPEVDGMRIETTEFSFHGVNREPPLEVESFWATEPFEGASAASAADTEPREEREVEHAEMELDESESIEAHEETHAHPLEWGTVDTMRNDSARDYADTRPPWARNPTPVSTQALEELKESEPWAVSPAATEPEIAEEEELTAQAMTGEPADAPAMEAPAMEAPASHPVAELLERIAARVREGEIEVPAGVESSEPAALAAVLTALLRQAS